ncbi:MAG TPA: ABC transporter substrate-binding protein [Caldilineae bacterium]|nr:ABC transporter substrate-binding protein [Caldilineae bacterium]
MPKRELSRREFLRLSAVVTAGIVSAACAPSTPAPEPTATPVPVAPTTPTAPAAAPTTQYKEAPMLAELVKQGKLPPVDERLPSEPVVVQVIEEIGQYGGTWEQAVTGQADVNGAMSYDNELWITFDESCQTWRPNVAKKVEVSEDGTEFTFYIREGHRWSDGEPFTADDIVFWYEDVVLNDELSPAKPHWMKSGDELGVVEKIDDYTVKYKFAKPHGLLLLYMSYVWGGRGGLEYPAHYLKQFHAKYADKDKLDQMVKDAGFETWDQLFWDKMSPTTNPELPVLRAWQLKDLGPPWIFERNPYFFKVDPEGNQLPYIDRVRLHAVEDKQMITLKVIAGELSAQWRNLSFSDLPLFMENREKGDYRVIKALAEHPMAFTIFPNQTLVGDDVMLSIIQDIRFRKALNLAIDRDEVNELIYLGERAPVQAAFPNLQDEPELFAHLTYDPEQAKALLDEMGLEVGPDGYRLRPDGQQLVAKVDVFSNKTLMDAAELVASYWEAIGIRTSLEEISYDLWWPRIFSHEYAFCAYVKDSIGGLARFVYLRSYAPVAHSTYWAPAWGLWYQSGGTQGVEPTGDARRAQQLFDEAKVTVDTDKQLELLTEIERLDLKNVWEVLTLGPGPNIRIVKNNFRNVPEVNYCVLHDSDAWAEQYFIKQT